MNEVNVKIHKIDNPRGKIVAFATLTIDDAVAINDIALVEGPYGIFLSFPQKADKRTESGYRDVAFPVSNSARNELTKLIVNEYKKVR